MKITMGASPLDKEQAERRHWTVSVLRAFGIIQIIGVTALSYVYFKPTLHALLAQYYGMSYDSSLLLATILSIISGLFVGFMSSAMIFAVAMLFQDIHTIKNYLQSIHIVGQYHDD